MAEKKTDRAGLLPQTLEAAGHAKEAVAIARVAAEQRLAPTTTMRLLEPFPQAAGVARVLFGADAPDAETPDAEAIETPDAEAEPTPLTLSAAAHSAMGEEMRRMAGFPTAAEAAANPSPGPTDAEQTAHDQINAAMRSMAGVNPDTKE